MSYADTLAIALTNARRAATSRLYVFADEACGDEEDVFTIDEIVAAVREQYEAEGGCGRQRSRGPNRMRSRVASRASALDRGDGV